MRPGSAPKTISDRVYLSVVIPVYNEEGAIAQTVAEVNQALWPLLIAYNIIVSDDGSTDGTLKKAEQSDAFVVTAPENSGYGAAIKCGIAAGNSEFVAIIDADGTYPADRLPEMLELAKSADMVVGERDAAMTSRWSADQPSVY